MAKELFLAGSTGYAVSLSLCPTESSTTPQPGTPTYVLVLCPRTCLTEHPQCVTNSSCELQSNPSIILGKVFPHPVKAGSYLLLLSRVVGKVTSATQQQPKPIAIMSPSPFSRQNNPTHIHCFLPSSALLRCCICSQTFHHHTTPSTSTTHDTLLSACVHECSSHPVTVLRLQVLPPRYQKSLSG